MAFVTYNPASDPLTSLVNAIYAGGVGATVVGGSITTRTGTPTGEASTIAFYDGAISALGIGSGLMLTSGDPTPPSTNTSSSYGIDTGADPADSDLQATVNAAFSGAGTVRDLTYLQFQINVTDAALTGLRFDVIFASDEFPEYSNSSYVDVAGVYVNGTNYALFNGSVSQPLSVLNTNVSAGNFRDNASGTIPIEYDGVSVKLQVTAPIHVGVNTIKIAIADTGDSIYDSSIFVSGLQAVNYQGFGLSQQVPVTTTAIVQDTSGNQTYLGNSLNNSIRLISGLDVFDGFAGLDTALYTFGLAGIDLLHSSWNGQTLTLQSGANISQLVHVERVLLADNYYFALDTSAGGTTFGVAALLHAALNANAPTSILSQWVAYADNQFALGNDLGDVGQAIINYYAPGYTNQQLIAYLYNSIVGSPAPTDTVNYLASIIGPTEIFHTMGDMYAYAALQPLNTNEMAGFTGSIQPLDLNFFV